MKKEPDIRPWTEKHKERRKQPTQPIYTVPSEMHQQMVDERDKKIAELQAKIDDEKSVSYTRGALDAIGKIKGKEPQPAREGWKEPIAVFGLFFLVLFCWMFWRFYPAAPKGTGDVTEVNQKPFTFIVSPETVGYTGSLTEQRDHWLRNCRASWKDLGCGHLGTGDKLLYLRNVYTACNDLNK